MEQKFDGTPKADLRLEGRKVVRTTITHDWGSLVRWVVKKDGKVVATPPARISESHEHADATPGTYEVGLQMWKYVNYKKDANGEFVDSKFVEIATPVTYKV